MELYIIRHGETVWNRQRRTQGRVRNMLSSNGKKELNNLAIKLKNINYDFIYCSPLLRAIQSANIINKFHNKQIIKDERLTDFDQGIFTGRYFNSLTNEEKVLKRNKDKSCKMESYKELYNRVYNFYNEVLLNKQQEKILIVTHSGVASSLENIINNIPFNNETYKKTDLFLQGQIKHFNIK